MLIVSQLLLLLLQPFFFFFFVFLCPNTDPLVEFGWFTSTEPRLSCWFLLSTLMFSLDFCAVNHGLLFLHQILHHVLCIFALVFTVPAPDAGSASRAASVSLTFIIFLIFFGFSFFIFLPQVLIHWSRLAGLRAQDPDWVVDSCCPSCCFPRIFVLVKHGLLFLHQILH